MTKNQNITNLISILGQIKNLRRRGWQKRQVTEPERDADHMYSVAFQTILLAPENLDIRHCLELALIHDLPEIYASDFVPGEIDITQKQKLEQAAACKIAKELNFPQLEQWFQEYEEQKTPEAQFVKCLDKLDNVLTASFYDRHNRSPNKLVFEFAFNAKTGILSTKYQKKDTYIKIINSIIKQTENEEKEREKKKGRGNEQD